MDETGIKLARANLRLFSKEMSPEYLRVRGLLLGHLAAQGATVEQLAQQEVNDRSNVHFVSQFARHLPPAKFHGRKWEFTTEDPMLAKTLHSHVVWVDTDVGMNESQKRDHDRRRGLRLSSDYRADGAKETYRAKRPYVILGKGVVKERETWLLTSIGERPLNERGMNYLGVRSCEYGEPFFFEPNRKSRKSIAKLKEIARSEFPAPDDMRALFDLDRHTLIITGNSPHSLTVRPRYEGYDLPKKRISDVELGQLDVNSHMDRLATELGITPHLDRLLEAHA